MALAEMLAALKNRGGVEGGGMDAPDTLEEEEFDEETEELDEEQMVDPRGMSADGNTIYISKELFPKGCKIGDTVSILATVTAHGDKYGVIPEEIAAVQDGGNTDEEEGSGPKY